MFPTPPSCLRRTVAAEVRKQVSRERSGSPHSSRRSSSSLGVSPCPVAGSGGVHTAWTSGQGGESPCPSPMCTDAGVCRGVCVSQGWSGGDTSFLDHPDGAPGWGLEETSCRRGKGWGLRNCLWPFLLPLESFQTPGCDFLPGVPGGRGQAPSQAAVESLSSLAPLDPPLPQQPRGLKSAVTVLPASQQGHHDYCTSIRFL